MCPVLIWSSEHRYNGPVGQNEVVFRRENCRRVSATANHGSQPSGVWLPDENQDESAVFECWVQVKTK